MKLVSLFTMESLKALIKEQEAAIQNFQISNAAELEQYRIQFLGTKGIVKSIFSEMKNVPVEFKKDAGQLLNAFKVLAEEKFAAHAHLQQSKATAQQTIDTTLPAAQLPIGTRHPLKIVENQ
ncbi:MAG: phenylalanine--tRNA ligase subunit alpha, partial [Bacteroidota bacterium]